MHEHGFLTAAFVHCEAWTYGGGALIEAGYPAFVAQPPDEKMPTKPLVPQFKLCHYDASSNTLSIPRDIRDKWLTDPVRAIDWRAVLKNFDSVHLPPLDSSDPQPQPEPDAQKVTPTANFMEVFPGEPATIEAFNEKYKKDDIFAEVSEGAVVYVLMKNEGVLYLHAKEATTLSATTPIVLYGAGRWLQDEKAKEFKEDANNMKKGVECILENDQAPLVVETPTDSPQMVDSPVTTLREKLISFEKNGNVDFTLCGFEYSRPPTVQNGTAADMFEIKAVQTLIWRPDKIADRLIKFNNMGSFGNAALFAASPLRLVWRFRHHTAQNAFAPAKPLWFLPSDLKLAKGQCVRLA